MRGYELTRARNVLRAELRRAAAADLVATGVALDQEELIPLVASGTNSRANVLRRRILIRGLVAHGLSQGDVAPAFGMTAAEAVAATGAPLLDATGIADAIEKRVLDELPETPEPGRYQPAAM
jgi:hypothetical protein